MTAIPGYTYGSKSLASSPVSLEQLELIKKSMLFGDEDVKYLRMSREILESQAEDVLDVWYGFVASNPHLVHYFANKSDGQPNTEYLTKVRKRFAQWILDTAEANYDQQWLDYQHEVGLRHHRVGKNKTDGVDSVEHIHFRYLPAFLFPITWTLKPFLAKKGHGADDVDKMHQAWVKAVTLYVILWSYPYVKEGDF